MALAKLGDEGAYHEIKKAWLGEEPGPYPGYKGNIALVADDWALFTLVEYLIERAEDPRMHAEVGPTDAPYDGQNGLLLEIRDIARVRRIPDLPTADYSPAGIVQWKAWLEKYKGQTFSRPVSESVSDPSLQCLARKVEWGYPDAMLEIARLGGKSALSVLQQFPKPSPGEPMGARGLFPEVLRQEAEGIPDRYREAQGNLQTSLALLGDEEMLSQIASEVDGFPYYWDYVPLEAVRKLKYIGGKSAVGILIGALGDLKGMEREGEKALEQCIEPSIYSGLHRTPEQEEYVRKVCDRDRYFGHVRDLNGLLMRTLAAMVKDPPLSADARATPDNFQKWKDWWAQNKDHAVVVLQRPARSFE